ncbi:MAG: S41 family peptidase [Pyrinomonadaceae bacterium]
MKIKKFLSLRSLKRIYVVCAIMLLLVGAAQIAHAQEDDKKISGFNLERARAMLRSVKTDIQKYYYDDKFRGIDLEARFKEADEKVKKASSLGHAFAIIAQVLVDFNDSHTYFVPPPRPSRTDYGWQMKMIGDKCYIFAVKPGSDAEAKGLKVGDEVWSIDGFEPTRANLWKMKYFYYSLRPRHGMQVIIRKPDGAEQEFPVMAKVMPGKQISHFADIFDFIRDAENEDRLNRHRYHEVGDELFIWKMPQFDMEDAQIGDMMSKVKKRKALILDLRGNGGGLALTLQKLVGYFFDREVKIADIKKRKESKPEIAKSRGDRVFTGQVVVLVDSESGSAAEMFARIIQLEKRGTVLGDRTAGAVMQSRYHGHESGVDIVAFYGVSVTEADVIMSDGKSLEHTGVTPDQLMLPTAAQMSAKQDPVLAHAASLVGVKIDAEKAGTLFPVEWRK